METYTGTIYRGRNYVTPIEVQIEVVCNGVGRTSCPECGGDGDWTKFYPEPETLTEPLQCVECKGTGKIFVSI